MSGWGQRARASLRRGGDVAVECARQRGAEPTQANAELVHALWMMTRDGRREVLGMASDAHCPEIWSAIKALTAEERVGLVQRVAETLGLG